MYATLQKSIKNKKFKIKIKLMMKKKNKRKKGLEQSFVLI